jgi:hypothetical protein
MAIDFPNSPSPGASFTANSKTWTFTDGKWILNVTPVGTKASPARDILPTCVQYEDFNVR